MASRNRDIGRHHRPGNVKRKAKEEKVKKELEVVSKMPRLTTFFSKQTNVFQETQSGSSQPCLPSVKIPLADVDIPKNAEADTSRAEGGDSDHLEKHGRNEKEEETENMQCVDKNFSTDLGEWSSKLDENTKEYWIMKGSKECQNINCKYTSSKRYYEKEKKNRYCQKSYFNRVHKLTKITQERNWLCYSPSKGRLFCFPCKVMGLNFPSTFTDEGFDDWKNGNFLLGRHEDSILHKKTVASLLNRKKKGERVDFMLINQLENEKIYWRKVLERVVEVIKFLAERGLPFRGSNETFGSPQNGNYLGLLELLAKFDPFLSEHINTHGNKGKGHISYFSKSVFEELINIIGAKMLDEIIIEIKNCKYFSISLDSTPDSANVDQLTLIMRYVLPSGPVERFIQFLEMEGHGSEQLAESILDFLKKYGIDINDCRGQSYDNANNMSGKYHGLQARIKEKCKYAEYVPCFAHSLNLVGKCAAECCSEAVRFFNFVENLYNFFSASTHRWGLLTEALGSSVYRLLSGTLPHENLPQLKRLSDTRWSARADATAALHKGYAVIINVLEDIAANMDAKADCRQQAKGLSMQMRKLETGIMVIMWDQILERFDKTSISLQSSEQDLNSACALYESLSNYVGTLRSTFNNIEEQGKILTNCQLYHQEVSRIRKRNSKFDNFYGISVANNSNNIESMQPSNQFRISVFNVIIDSLINALSTRQSAYLKLSSMFGFLRHLPKLEEKEIRDGAAKIVEAYPEDVEKQVEEELVQFSELLKTELFDIVEEKEKLDELKLYNILVENSFGSCFPNLEIILRIYLTLMVTNCSGERSFSKLKRIKNEIRANMNQIRLNSLSMMSIEHELLRNMDTSKIIDDFAVAKSRKRIM